MYPLCVSKRNLPGKKPKLDPRSLERKIQKLDESSTASESVKRKRQDQSDGEEDDQEDGIKVEREVLDVPDENDDEVEISSDAPKKKKTKKAEPEKLSVSGFVWDPTDVKDEPEDSSSGEEDEEEVSFVCNFLSFLNTKRGLWVTLNGGGVNLNLGVGILGPRNHFLCKKSAFF
jgi:hypothetical protein